jgi:hypothetical protein
MRRTLLCCFAGAGTGFFFAFVLAVTTSALSTPDGGAILLLVGAFLAGIGAIAGAIVGVVADLLEFFKKREHSRQWPVNHESDSES